ncbi:hypothetical protein STEG23_003250, partial [Scotinomys teguina]
KWDQDLSLAYELAFETYFQSSYFGLPSHMVLLRNSLRHLWFYTDLFIYMVYYIDRLSYIEPSLHLWDKAYLVMVDNVFDVFLDCYVANFISDFINLDVISLPFEKVPWGAEKKQKYGPFFHIHSVNLCLFIGFLYLDGYFLIYVGKIFFNDFVEYVFCVFELVFFSFFYPYYSKPSHLTFLSLPRYPDQDRPPRLLYRGWRGSCFSLSLSIPILDCHHTWCCCGTPLDFYCATQT